MHNTYIYILVMAVVTYIVRVIPLVFFKNEVIPLVFFKNEIKSVFIKSFLHYVPYVTLSVMTFPAIITASGNSLWGVIGFAVAIIVSLIKGSLPLVASCCCLAVYISSLIF